MSPVYSSINIYLISGFFLFTEANSGFIFVDAGPLFDMTMHQLSANHCRFKINLSDTAHLLLMLPAFPEKTTWKHNSLSVTCDQVLFRLKKAVALSCHMEAPTAVCSPAVLGCMQERNVVIL